MRFALAFGFALLCSTGSVVIACVGDDPVANAPASAVEAGVDGATPAIETDAGVEGGARILPRVEAGGQVGCVLLPDRTVWCWGRNAYGESGSPLSEQAHPPKKVDGLSDVIQISAGTFSVCALKADSSVWCWGRNTEGELGRAPESVPLCGSARCSPTPLKVPNVAASEVAVGDGFACAISGPRREVTCWGVNALGQAARAAEPTVLPGVVPALENIVHIRLGFPGDSVCALSTSAQVWCWGKNHRGQLGHTPGTQSDKTATDGYFNDVPHKVTVEADGGGGFLSDVADVVTTETTCVAKKDGTVWCWGHNGEGQLALGHADTLVHAKPLQITGIAGATAVRAGRAACALVGGEAWCWGADSVARANGQGTDGGCASFGIPTLCYGPARVPSPALATLSVNASLAFAVTTDGVVVGWGHGANESRLGHPSGTAGDEPSGVNTTPSPVIGLP